MAAAIQGLKTNGIQIPDADIYFVDLFAGAGGVSTGIHEAVSKSGNKGHLKIIWNDKK